MTTRLSNHAPARAIDPVQDTSLGCNWFWAEGAAKCQATDTSPADCGATWRQRRGTRRSYLAIRFRQVKERLTCRIASLAGTRPATVIARRLNRAVWDSGVPRSIGRFGSFQRRVIEMFEIIMLVQLVIEFVIRLLSGGPIWL